MAIRTRVKDVFSKAQIKTQKLVQKAKEPVNNFLDKAAYQTRCRWMKDWMEMSGVDRWQDIDYSNPDVMLQYLLCDFRWINKVKSEKGRLQLRQEYGQEVYDMYMLGGRTDPKTGKYQTYRDIEKTNVRKAISEGMRNARTERKAYRQRKKKGDDYEFTDKEIEEYIESSEFIDGETKDILKDGLTDVDRRQLDDRFNKKKR